MRVHILNSLGIAGVFIWAIMFLNGCDRSQDLNSDTTMAQIIAELYSKEGYPENYTSNRKGVIELRKRLVTDRSDQQTRSLLAIQYMLAGENDSALMHLDSLQASGIRHPMIGQLKALCWFRIGEVRNCIERCVNSSCIVPFSVESEFKQKNATDSAIVLYRRLIQNDSNDIISKWMYNIAMGNLGRSKRVPTDWKIPVLINCTDTTSVPIFKHKVWYSAKPTRLGGLTVEDFTGDGYFDVLTTSMGLDEEPTVYINQGDGRFTLRKQHGLSGITGGVNTIHADYDNDGDNDVLVLRGGWLQKAGVHPASLLRNDGRGNFTDVTLEVGLGSLHPRHSAVFADFNRDGHLDIFMGNETGLLMEGAVVKGPPHPCELFISNGDGTFSEKAAEASLAFGAWVKGVVCADFNNDGQMDIYLSIFGGDNRLLLNKGNNVRGIPLFTDISVAAGVTAPFYSFPCAAFDFNNDGHTDIVIAAYHPDSITYINEMLGGQVSFPLHIYINKGDETFQLLESNGLHTSVHAMGFGTGDIDNDGFLDIYAGTGAPELRSLVPNLLLKNNNGINLTDITSHSRTGHLQKGHGLAFADINRSGHQDILINLGGFFEGDVSYNALFSNPGTANSAVSLLLTGTDCNRSAIGTRVRAVFKEDGRPRTVHREVGAQGSYADSPLEIHIGIGSATTIDTLEVIWHGSGRKDVFTGLVANQRYHLKELGSLRPQSVKFFNKVLSDSAYCRMIKAIDP